jgi:hypothetical protein
MSKARGLADLGNVYSDGALSNRNLIINGAMQVAQRGTSSTGVTGSGYFAVDRFKIGLDTLGTHTLSQAADGPAGFAKSYKIEVTTADAAPAAGDNFGLDQRFEGQNLQMLKKGTADAESVTLSFWVKSNKTGTYNVEFEDITNARNIIGTYTVDVSGTWEYKTITFAGDTSGALIADSSLRVRVLWWLGSGTDFSSGTRNTSWAATVNANRAVGNVNLAATIGNYFQITGVQLEAGDTATPFEHRIYGQELALCKRYFRRFGNGGTRGVMGVGGFSSLTAAQVVIALDPEMRVVPTLSVVQSGVVLDFGVATLPITAVAFAADTTNYNLIMLMTVAGGIGSAAQGDACTVVGGGGANMDYRFDAEL